LDKTDNAVKDSFPTIISDLKEKESVAKEKKKKEFDARIKHKNKLDVRRRRKAGLKKLIVPDTYITAIQFFEPLIETIAKDVIFFTMIASTLYLFYIIVTFKVIMFDWKFILLKILGSSVVILISYFILDNWEEREAMDRLEEEEGDL